MATSLAIIVSLPRNGAESARSTRHDAMESGLVGLQIMIGIFTLQTATFQYLQNETRFRCGFTEQISVLKLNLLILCLGWIH